MTIQTKTLRATCTKTPATKRAYKQTVHRPSETARDKAYDPGYNGLDNKVVSVYSNGAVISISRTVGQCVSCRRTQPLLNNYCDLCRSNGANERQVMSPRAIQAKQRTARANSQKAVGAKSRPLTAGAAAA